MNRKVLIFTGVGIALFFIIIVVILVSLSSNRSSDRDLDDNRAPTTQQNDGNISRTQISPGDTLPMELLETQPEENLDAEYSEILSVKFIFSVPVNESTLSYTISPDTEVNVSVDGDEVTFTPVTFWPEGRNQITIDQALTSTLGLQLNEDATFSFDVAIPEGL